MKTIDSRNLSDAIGHAIPYLLKEGIRETSRNGDVLAAPHPVLTVYNNPKEHVLFSPSRNANPFFHLMEALWMLGGRNDLEWPVQFNKRFAEYSDDGMQIWGAYGFRWRAYFGFDQLAVICQELTNNPNSRRAVLSMWAADGDLTEWESGVGGLKSKDVPCNTQAYFDVRGGKLNMTVCNRSNDAIWGAYGANAVHFSILLEYMAEQIGVPMGVYRQFSNNFHVYTDVYSEDILRDISVESQNAAYAWDYPPTIALGSRGPGWGKALMMFLQNGEADWERQDFFSMVAAPMYNAWFVRKNDPDLALEYIEKMPLCDWKIASAEYISRNRKDKANAA